MQERQQGALCLKHAINNLLQQNYFSKADMDRIAKSLPRQGFRLFNPHKYLCLGNYDVVIAYLDTIYNYICFFGRKAD